MSQYHPPMPSPRDTAFRKARTCYDHLAGVLVGALLAALEGRRVRRDGERGAG